MLWLLAGDSRVKGVQAALTHPRATVLVSAVSLWEVAIKASLGKLTAPDDLPAQLGRFAFESLPITDAHAWAVRDLPPHHSDPFDRLLIAQALVEGATLVSTDTAFDAYGVERLW